MRAMMIPRPQCFECRLLACFVLACVLLLVGWARCLLAVCVRARCVCAVLRSFDAVAPDPRRALALQRALQRPSRSLACHLHGWLGWR